MSVPSPAVGKNVLRGGCKETLKLDKTQGSERWRFGIVANKPWSPWVGCKPRVPHHRTQETGIELETTCRARLITVELYIVPKGGTAAASGWLYVRL